MFVGHGLLAFALAALGARRLGRDPRTALWIGVVAGLFATIPDVDALYGLVGVAGAAGPAIPVESFWEAGNRLHRGATHSLLIGGGVALAAALVAQSDPVRRRAGVALLTALAALVFAVSGPVSGAVVALVGLLAVGVVAVAVSVGLGARAIGGAAALGVVSHPFGDLLTGSPPAFLYPLDVTLVSERMVLSADPTLHLLGAFGVELATVWLAAAVLYALSGRSLPVHVDRRAALGVGYAGAAVTIPAPTLEVSYQFVFSVLAVGSVGVTPRSRSLRDVDPWRTLATGLAAVTLAALAYAAVYAL